MKWVYGVVLKTTAKLHRTKRITVDTVMREEKTLTLSTELT
jgi:hypothetical protein